MSPSHLTFQVILATYRAGLLPGDSTIEATGFSYDRVQTRIARHLSLTLRLARSMRSFHFLDSQVTPTPAEWLLSLLVTVMTISYLHLSKRFLSA
jgi:hypothetical protein